MNPFKSFSERGTSRTEHPRDRRLRACGRTYRGTGSPAERETGDLRYGKSRTGCHEHCYDILFHRYSFRISAPQRSTTRRLGHLAGERPAVLISNSGKTREIVELTQLAHNLNPDLKFIVITGNPDSPLAHESDVCLSTGKPKEVCALGMTPTLRPL